MAGDYDHTHSKNLTDDFCEIGSICGYIGTFQSRLN
jgi:hypothetical protein